MALMSGPRYDAHGRRVYDDDVFDGIGRADEDDEDTESVTTMRCRWCGVQIEQLPGYDGWFDRLGWSSCGKYQRHWPVEPVAVPMPSGEERP